MKVMEEEYSPHVCVCVRTLAHAFPSFSLCTRFSACVFVCARVHMPFPLCAHAFLPVCVCMCVRARACWCVPVSLCRFDSCCTGDFLGAARTHTFTHAHTLKRTHTFTRTRKHPHTRTHTVCRTLALPSFLYESAALENTHTCRRERTHAHTRTHRRGGTHTNKHGHRARHTHTHTPPGQSSHPICRCVAASAFV